MSEPNDLREVETFVSNLLTTLKDQVTREARGHGFFPHGINRVSANIGGAGDITFQLDISGTGGALSGTGDTIPDRFVRPMYLVVPTVANDTVKRIDVIITVTETNGTVNTIDLPNLPQGTTTVNCTAAGGNPQFSSTPL